MSLLNHIRSQLLAFIESQITEQFMTTNYRPEGIVCVDGMMYLPWTWNDGDPVHEYTFFFVLFSTDDPKIFLMFAPRLTEDLISDLADRLAEEGDNSGWQERHDKVFARIADGDLRRLTKNDVKNLSMSYEDSNVRLNTMLNTVAYAQFDAIPDDATILVMNKLEGIELQRATKAWVVL